MKTLDESIAEHGLLNPIVVERLNNGRYRLIDGQNRFGCVRAPTIACHVIGEEDICYILKTKIYPRKR